MAVLSTLRGDFVRDYKLIWHEGYEALDKHADEHDCSYFVNAMAACAMEDPVYLFNECLILKDTETMIDWSVKIDIFFILKEESNDLWLYLFNPDSDPFHLQRLYAACYCYYCPNRHEDMEPHVELNEIVLESYNKYFEIKYHRTTF